MKKTLLFAILLMLVNQLNAQKTLPSISLRTLEGKAIDSKNIPTKGKITILSFWATWCAPCKKELDAISKSYAQWQKDYDVELIAISIDNAQGISKVKPLVAQKGWKYRILSDENSQLLNSLGGQSVPYTLLLDKNGTITDIHNGYISGDEKELEHKIAELSK
jgi:cytochrome c biogenesis protein CcmG, thiol:disulfide interchange protein DsbE